MSVHKKPEPNFFQVDNIINTFSDTMYVKSKMVSPEFLSKVWNIDKHLAYKTLDQNTQLKYKGINNDIARLLENH